MIFVALAFFLLIFIWTGATNPKLTARLLSSTCVERFAELHQSPDRQIVGPPSTRFLQSAFGSNVFPVGRSTESVVTDVVGSYDIPTSDTDMFMIFDNTVRERITIQIVDRTGAQVGTYDFDYCGRIF